MCARNGGLPHQKLIAFFPINVDFVSFLPFCSDLKLLYVGPSPPCSAPGPETEWAVSGQVLEPFFQVDNRPCHSQVLDVPPLPLQTLWPLLAQLRAQAPCSTAAPRVSSGDFLPFPVALVGFGQCSPGEEVEEQGWLWGARSPSECHSWGQAFSLPVLAPESHVSLTVSASCPHFSRVSWFSIDPS